MKHYKQYQIIAILTPFVFSFAFGLDIYIPIVPEMSHIFDTTPWLIQLTLSLFLLTMGVGQLFIGPLADQWGRKAIFYASSACFTLGALACALSPNITLFIIARIISSIGACGMLVTSFALSRDLYSGNESAKMFSFLNGAIGISPTFAPIIGGYLAYYFGWQSIFYFLMCIGLVALAITKWKIQETLPKEARIKLDSAIFKRYLTILLHPQFTIYATLAGLAEGVFFCFFSISPFIIIELLEVPTHQFGYYFAVFGAMIGLGGFVAGKIIGKWGENTTVTLGIALMLGGGFSMLVWYGAAGLTLTGFLVPMAVACMGAMFLLGASAAKALGPFKEIAGTASAALGAFEFALPTIAGSILMLFPITSTIPYGITILLLGILALIVKNSHKYWVFDN